jgi:ribonuclease J
MTFRVRIHRGAAQVGGTCVELESEGKRLLLDLGIPLDAEEGEAPLPDVPGLESDDPSLLGVLVSHLHGDHCGLVPFARPGLPLGMGETASRILREATFFNGRGALPEPTWALRDGVPIEIGPFRITPYQVEHSAPDSFALLVEAGGRRIFYTGDFRSHGNDPHPFRRLVERPPPTVDALLMEGTQIGDGREGNGPSESDLRRTLAGRFKEWPGLVIATWSSQNLDRLRTFHEAAREAGRTLVVDLYTATLAREARVRGVPIPGSEGLEVYCRLRERLQVKEAEEFERTKAVRRWRIFPEEVAPRASELVLMFRPGMLRELERAGALAGSIAIWSMWSGYLAESSGQWVRERLAAAGVPLEVHHVSGHAYVKDLQALVGAFAPAQVVPIHTSDPEGYARLFPRVERKPDGEWWGV